MTLDNIVFSSIIELCKLSDVVFIITPSLLFKYSSKNFWLFVVSKVKHAAKLFSLIIEYDSKKAFLLSRGKELIIFKSFEL